jgi:hypothetical protein
MWLRLLTKIATYQKTSTLVVMGPCHDDHHNGKDFPVTLPKELWYLFGDLHLEELRKGEILARLIKRKSCFSDLPPATVPNNLILDLSNLQLLNRPTPQSNMEVDTEVKKEESKTNKRLFHQLYLMMKSYIGTVRTLQDIIQPNMQQCTPTPFPTSNMFATPTSQAPFPVFGANGQPMVMPLPSPPTSLPSLTNGTSDSSPSPPSTPPSSRKVKKPKELFKNTLRCWHCRKKGHTRATCPNRLWPCTCTHHTHSNKAIRSHPLPKKALSFDEEKELVNKTLSSILSHMQEDARSWVWCGTRTRQSIKVQTLSRVNNVLSDMLWYCKDKTFNNCYPVFGPVGIHQD